MEDGEEEEEAESQSVGRDGGKENDERQLVFLHVSFRDGKLTLRYQWWREPALGWAAVLPGSPTSPAKWQKDEEMFISWIVNAHDCRSVQLV